jgi:hypothetical protein
MTVIVIRACHVVMAVVIPQALFSTCKVAYKSRFTWIAYIAAAATCE